MQRIWKYPLKVSAEQEIHVPVGYKILTVTDETLTNPPCIYALVDDEKRPLVTVKVYMAGTGFALDKHMLAKCSYIGTVITQQGTLVWHVFVDYLTIGG